MGLITVTVVTLPWRCSHGNVCHVRFQSQPSKDCNGIFLLPGNWPGKKRSHVTRQATGRVSETKSLLAIDQDSSDDSGRGIL